MARTSAPSARSSTGAIAPQPSPNPARVRSVSVNSPARARSIQNSTLFSSETMGATAFAATITVAEQTPRAVVAYGWTASAAATGPRRNGIAAIRNRGPGVQPPKGRK